jgi:hypothetical protein
MNSSSLFSGQTEAADVVTMSRREAIKRAAMLLGVAFSPSLVENALQAQTAAASGATAKPVYFSAKQFEAVSAIADRILPRTDTPGALDVGVPAFADLMYGKFLSAADQKVVVAGLAELEAASGAAHRRGFAQLTPEQQDALLTKVAEASKTKERTFFHQIKELVVLGYFSSERIGKTVLHYDPVPGRFDGCIPIAEVGNVAWTK